MDPDSERPALVERIAVEAITKRLQKRVEFIDDACGDDPELRDVVMVRVAELDQRIGELTRLLRDVGEGDQDAMDRLWWTIYDELRRMARGRLRLGSDAMNPTELVHEAFLRLRGGRDEGWPNRRYFFGAVSRAMLQVLIDGSRRNGLPMERRVPMDGLAVDGMEDVSAEELKRALEQLEETHPRVAEVMHLRAIIGLKVDHVALILEVSPRTIKNDASFGRAWLHRALSGRERRTG